MTSDDSSARKGHQTPSRTPGLLWVPAASSKPAGSRAVSRSSDPPHAAAYVHQSVVLPRRTPAEVAMGSDTEPIVRFAAPVDEVVAAFLARAGSIADFIGNKSGGCQTIAHSVIDRAFEVFVRQQLGMVKVALGKGSAWFDGQGIKETWSIPSARTRSTDARASARVWPGRPSMRSALIRSKPAARASRTEVTKSLKARNNSIFPDNGTLTLGNIKEASWARKVVNGERNLHAKEEDGSRV